jgi:glycine cleavage system aminomethyltransferase T
VTVTHPTVGMPSLADRLQAAGAVMVLRDGHPVAGNFGSAATELAVCVKRVGLAVRSDLDVLEVTGAEPWLSHFLADALGGRPCPPGRACRVAGTWCCRLSADRALVVGSWSAAARWALLGRRAIVTGTAVEVAGRARTDGALTLVGPRAARLLTDAGLSADMAPGGVRETLLAGAPAVLLRETDERWLLIMDSERAGDAWRALLQAGRSLGLSLVGTEALERLAAAPRMLH